MNTIKQYDIILKIIESNKPIKSDNNNLNSKIIQYSLLATTELDAINTFLKLYKSTFKYFKLIEISDIRINNNNAEE